MRVELGFVLNVIDDVKEHLKEQDYITCMNILRDANKIILAGGAGVTLKNRSNYTATAGNYAIATIVNIGGGIIVTAGDMQ